MNIAITSQNVNLDHLWSCSALYAAADDEVELTIGKTNPDMEYDWILDSDKILTPPTFTNAKTMLGTLISIHPKYRHSMVTLSVCKRIHEVTVKGKPLSDLEKAILGRFQHFPYEAMASAGELFQEEMEKNRKESELESWILEWHERLDNGHCLVIDTWPPDISLKECQDILSRIVKAASSRTHITAIMQQISGYSNPPVLIISPDNISNEKVVYLCSGGETRYDLSKLDGWKHHNGFIARVPECMTPQQIVDIVKR